MVTYVFKRDIKLTIKDLFFDGNMMVNKMQRQVYARQPERQKTR